MEEKMLAKKNSEVKINTLLGSSSDVTGDFKAEGSVRIDGRINGNVTVTGVLIVGAGGTVSGNVSARSAIIGGEVLGDVTVSEKTELTATAKVLGDISTSVIVIDENAVFQGKCDMKQEIPETASRAAQAKAIRAGRKSAKAAIAEALKEVKEEELREENEAASAEDVQTGSEEI
jgi:cytoskeletal protein CcmA (bactofilin family)